MVVGIIVVVGVGVIGILAALAVPAFNQVQTKAKIIRTKAVLSDLKLGIMNFEVEYNRTPVNDSLGVPSSAVGQLVQGKFLDALLGADKAVNPREIQFVDLPSPPTTGKGPGVVMVDGVPTAVDVWGSPILVLLSSIEDRSVTDPEHPGSVIREAVVLWSAGPDGNFVTWADNVASWK